MRIKNKKRFVISIIILLLIIVLIIFGVIKLFSSKDTEEVVSTDVQEETQEVEKVEEEIEEEAQESKKIDFLANVTEPMYKKSEKNIKIPVIIYHAFSTPEPEGDIYKLFSTQARFEENVTTLLNAGYTFITLEDVYAYNKEEIALPEKVCVITMDDGWLGCYTEAFAVLKKYNIPATIFIVSDLVGTQDYFSWEQAKEMYDTGLVKLHIHGKSHIEYSSVAKEKLVSDYTSAHKELEEKMGEEIQKIMAYPAGKYSDNSKKWLKEAGFEVQVLTKYGTVNKSRTLDLTDIGRIRGERATGKQLLSTIQNASV